MATKSFSLTKALLLGTVALSTVRATMLREMENDMIQDDQMQLAQQHGWGECFCQHDDEGCLEDVDEEGSTATRSPIPTTTDSSTTSTTGEENTGDNDLAAGSTCATCGCKGNGYGENHY